MVLAAHTQDEIAAGQADFDRHRLAAHGRQQPADIVLEGKRGTPNCFLRSALFSAIYGNAKRKYLKNALLAVQGDVSITYTGEQLSQSDLDFVMAALHLARQCKTPADFLQRTPPL